MFTLEIHVIDENTYVQFFAVYLVNYSRSLPVDSTVRNGGVHRDVEFQS